MQGSGLTEKRSKMIWTKTVILLIASPCWLVSTVNGRLTRGNVLNELIIENKGDQGSKRNANQKPPVLLLDEENQSNYLSESGIWDYNDDNEYNRVKRSVEENVGSTEPPAPGGNGGGRRPQRRRPHHLRATETPDEPSLDKIRPKKHSRGRSRNCTRRAGRGGKGTKLPKGEKRGTQNDGDSDSPILSPIATLDEEQRPKKHSRRKSNKPGITEDPTEVAVTRPPKDRSGRRRKCRKGTHLPERRRQGRKRTDRPEQKGFGNPSSSPSPDSIIAYPRTQVPSPVGSKECSIKNRKCVPRCSELSDEQIFSGAQCAEDPELPPDLLGLFPSRNPPN